MLVILDHRLFEVPIPEYFNVRSAHREKREQGVESAYESRMALRDWVVTNGTQTNESFDNLDEVR